MCPVLNPHDSSNINFHIKRLNTINLDNLIPGEIATVLE